MQGDLHGYVTVESDRKTIIFWVAVSAYVASNWLQFHAHPQILKLPTLANFEWAISILTPSVLFFFFYQLIDKMLWRTLIHFGQAAPDFSGRWEGRSSFKYCGRRQESKIVIDIQQTWTGIRIHADTAREHTSSRMGAA